MILNGRELTTMTYNLPNESQVRAHDIFDPLPGFMLAADVIFTDPPYNQSLCTNFLNKDGSHVSNRNTRRFVDFMMRLFSCIAEIDPHTCYLEMGKEYLGECLTELKKLYPHVTFYNSTYYHKKDNLCYVIRASRKRKKLPLDGMDEEDIIKWVCANEDYQCIGDLCMGKGLVGLHAYRNSKRFVGTELNHKRLSVLIEAIVKEGGVYTCTC
jgi:hypothetical protein